MVFMHFPQHLTEEEEMLQRKYAKLRKKKKALAALRAPKSEPPPSETDAKSKKRTAEAAADATEQAKKLLKLGAIRVESDKKDVQSFKRSKRPKDQEKSSVGFTPFSPSHSSDPREEEDRSEGGRQRSSMRGLYDSFVSSREPRFEREREHEHERDSFREREDRRDERRDRDPPKRGNTIYIHGVGLSEDLIRKTFSNIGTIVHVNMEKEKSCGFVTYDKMESAEQAISEMNGTMVGDVQLRVSMARRQPNFESMSDPSSASWASIAANQSAKGSFKDKRDLVSYEDESLFSDG